MNEKTIDTKLDELSQVVATGFAEMHKEFGEVRKEIAGVRTDLTKEIGSVRSDLSKEIGSVRKDVDDVRTDLAKEIGSVRDELTKEIGNVRTDLTKEIDNVRTDLTNEIGSVRTDLSKEIDTKIDELAQMTARGFTEMGERIGRIEENHVTKEDLKQLQGNVDLMLDKHIGVFRKDHDALAVRVKDLELAN